MFTYGNSVHCTNACKYLLMDLGSLFMKEKTKNQNASGFKNGLANVKCYLMKETC